MIVYSKGLVSVVMPTYKRSEKLTRAIDSVLNQTYKNIELILVNDNEPTDDFTKELISRVEKYKQDKRFRLIVQEKHVNGAVARNIGIKNAKGEYIAFLDDDDWWVESKIEKQVNELNALDSTWGGVSCKFTLFNSTGDIIGKTSKYRDGYIYKDILFLTTDVATGTLLLRREALDNTRCFDENLLRHQDLQLLVDFTEKYKLKEVDDYLHCVDVSDSQNRPDPQKLIKYKEKFFASIQPVIDRNLSEKEKKCMYSIHKFELGYVCIKNHQMIKGVTYCLAVFKSYMAFKLAIQKIQIKLCQIFSR